jgi:sarcosine oxidase
MRAVIVGAGVMGLATARELARRGHEVEVYEQFELGHMRGSSHGKSRIFRLSYTEERWIRLAQRAYELWRELERDSGTQLLALNGLLNVEPDPTQRLRAFDECGVTYEVLTPSDVRARFGVVYDDVERIVFTPDAGISLADDAVRVFAEEAQKHGAAIRTRTRVESLDDLDADAIVVTAGGWAPKLLAGSGIDLPAQPTRETIAYFALLDGDAFPSVIDELAGMQYFALAAPGVGVKAGIHHSGKPTDPDEEEGPDPEVVERISEWIARRVPHADPSAISAESCIYTNTADENFVCELHERIVVVSSCSGHGFKFAPAVGEQLANLAERANRPRTAA